MGRSGIGADEQVGALQQGGGLGDAQGPGPIAEAVVRLQVGRQGKVLDPPDDDDAPAAVEEPLDQDLPRSRGPALGGRAGPQVDGQQWGPE